MGRTEKGEEEGSRELTRPRDAKNGDFRKTSSKKRGRPALLSTREAEIVDNTATQATARGKQNHYYFLLALASLPADDPRFAWLLPRGDARVTILSELGRFGDTDVIQNLALQICEDKMTTRKAVRLLRTARGVKLPATSDHATSAIFTTIENFEKTHPDITIDQVIEAVTTVLRTLQFQREVLRRKAVAA